MNAPGWLSLALSHSATSCLVTARGSARQNSGSGEDLAPSAASLTQFRSIKAAWEREGAGLEWGQRWWGLSDSGSEVGPCLGFPAVSTGIVLFLPEVLRGWQQMLLEQLHLVSEPSPCPQPAPEMF